MRSPPRAVMAVAALLLLLLLLVSLAAAADTTASSEREREQKRQELYERVLADWKAGHGKNLRSDEDARRVFAEWKALHGKKYSSAAEEELRYSFFKDRLRQVDMLNAALGPEQAFTINDMFSDYTDEEMRALTKGFIRYPTLRCY